MTIRCGITRTVLLWRDWAIKVPSCRHGLTHFLNGWVGNRNESDRWGWCTDDGRHLLCPVLGSYLFGFVLVMRRAGEVEEEELTLGELHPFKALTTDVHADNVGRMEDGRLVLVDYA